MTLAIPRGALADPPPAPPPGPPIEPQPPAEKKPLVSVTPTGYVEAYYAYNFNRPSNGITNYRGFDNRHNTFSLANAALGANLEAGPIGGRVTLQVGSTPSTYYMSEPGLPGAGGASASNTELWKYLQEAYVSYKAPIGRGLLLQLGLCASPIGYEVFAIKDNWNWSRSNLFFGFPYYHTGLRVTYEFTPELSSTMSLFNGWNSVVDNNEEKSVQTNVTYKVTGKVLLQALYFGGVERPKGSPEGPYWRHHLDVFGQWDATPSLSFAAQVDYGVEPNRVGAASWGAGALYARFKARPWLYLALRGDVFQERLAASGGQSSAPLFWNGARWVGSGTATLDLRPHDQISIRLEYRHDEAESPLYFKGEIAGDGGSRGPFMANAKRQDTLLLGATAWF